MRSLVSYRYQAEWGQPNKAVDMADQSERFKESGLLVDELELAARMA
ncbi:hypothetical protein [Paenibacillus etheri]|nr:hypothetical protein [Paenibacillus etheri]